MATEVLELLSPDDPRLEPQTLAWGWLLAIHKTSGERHGMPTYDTREHIPSAECWCGPVVDIFGVVAHNSHDGRERYEHGHARRH